MFGKLVVGICMVTGCFLFSSVTMAQTSTARILGVITDETEGVLPGVQVVVRNVDTGVRRSYATDARGRYFAPELVPGAYEVTVTLTGFDTLVRRGITLVVGQEANISLTMRVGAVTEQVTVTGEAPLVDTRSSALSGVVEERRITDLPLNGRDFTQLALVQTGVVSIRNADVGASKGFGTRVSLAGSRPDQTGWLLDGTNVNSIGNFGIPGSSSGIVMGVDAVREFRVLSGSYSAEFGGSSGGMIQMVTKSGTNQLHGTVYEFLRNDNFDARKFFDEGKAEFRRNQFGASVGGPIKKERAFFFGNFEGLRQARVGETLIDNVPDENVHRGLIPASGGGLRQVNIAPSVKPHLDVWPLPNGPAVGVNSGVAQRLTPVTNVTDQNYFVTRVDYHINSNQTLFGRFTLDQGNDSVPAPLGIFNTAVVSRMRYTSIQYDSIMSPRLLSSSRVAYNRNRLGQAIGELNIDYPKSLHFLGLPFPPTLSYPGVTGCCFGGSRLADRTQNLYEFSEALSYQSAGHSIKFGGKFEKVGFNLVGSFAASFGSFGWASVEDFLLDNRLLSFEIGEVPGSSTFRTLRQRRLGLYFQDDWQVSPNLTLNLGLRYEPFTAPSEKWGRVSTLRDWVTATAFDTGGTMWDNHSKKNFAPRVGLAWAPKGNGRTALRAGFGLFYAIPTPAYVNTISRRNPPFTASLTTVQGNFASAAADTLRVGPTLLTPQLKTNTFAEFAQWNMRPTYEIKFNASVEREIVQNLSLTVGYVGSRGVHLWRMSDANGAPAILVEGRPFVPAGTPRVNRNGGPMQFRQPDAQSFYNAMTVEVKQRFSRGFQFQGSYTWSKTIDDSATGFANTDFLEGTTSQPYGTKSDRGLSPLHLAHNLVFNGIWSLPSPASSGIASYLFGGWQLSGIYSASTGTPIQVNIAGYNAPDLSRSPGRQRPDLVAGRNNGNITSGTTAGCDGVPTGQKLGTPELWYDPCAFFLPPPGFYGNAGRNILIGPGFSNVDFSVLKTTPVRINEGSRLQFHADFFNLFNRAYFARPRVNVLNASDRRPVPGAGQITSTVGDARQMQFGLKLIF